MRYIYFHEIHPHPVNFNKIRHSDTGPGRCKSVRKQTLIVHKRKGPMYIYIYIYIYIFILSFMCTKTGFLKRFLTLCLFRFRFILISKPSKQNSLHFKATSNTLESKDLFVWGGGESCCRCKRSATPTEQAAMSANRLPESRTGRSQKALWPERRRHLRPGCHDSNQGLRVSHSGGWAGTTRGQGCPCPNFHLLALFHKHAHELQDLQRRSLCGSQLTRHELRQLQ